VELLRTAYHITADVFYLCSYVSFLFNADESTGSNTPSVSSLSTPSRRPFPVPPLQYDIAISLYCYFEFNKFTSYYSLFWCLSLVHIVELHFKCMFM